MIGSILAISLRVGSRFAQLTRSGIAMMLFLYVFVNVAMATGLAGCWRPLPLISYGDGDADGVVGLGSSSARLSMIGRKIDEEIFNFQ